MDVFIGGVVVCELDLSTPYYSGKVEDCAQAVTRAVLFLSGECCNMGLHDVVCTCVEAVCTVANDGIRDCKLEHDVLMTYRRSTKNPQPVFVGGYRNAC